MKTVLLNHVVKGTVGPPDVTDGMMVENLAGNMMTLRGPIQLKTFWLEFWLEKQLEIPY